MWSRSDQKKKKKIKENLSDQETETDLIQMPILTTASDLIEVLHSAKRQRRPSVRLGEIGDLPAAFFTERRYNPVYVVNHVDPSEMNQLRSKEKSIDLERLKQENTVDFNRSKEKTIVPERSNKVKIIDRQKLNKETSTDSERSTKEGAIDLERSRKKEEKTTDFDSSKKENANFDRERSNKENSIDVQWPKNGKSIDSDWSSKEKSIKLKISKEDSIKSKRSKEKSIDSGKTIDLERDRSPDFVAENDRKTACNYDVEAVQHTIRLVDVTISESCLDLHPSTHGGIGKRNREDFLRNINVNHQNATVPKKNCHDLHPSSSGGIGKKNLEVRITEQNSMVLPGESPQNEQNLSLNDRNSIVPKEISFGFHQSSQGSIGKRNPEELLKNMSINAQNANKKCVIPPKSTSSIAKLHVAVRSIDSPVNADGNLTGSDVKDILHPDDEKSCRSPEDFRVCDPDETDDRDDTKDTSNSGEGDMNLSKSHEEDIAMKIPNRHPLQQGERDEDNAINRQDGRENSESNDNVDAKLHDRETTTVPGRNANQELRDVIIRDGNVDHHKQIKMHNSYISNDGVKGWLQDLGLSKYVENFEVHEVDLEVLPLLTFDDLREMGIMTVGSRRRLFCAIQQLRRRLMVNTDQSPVFGP